MITKKQLSFIDRNKKRDKAEIEQLQNTAGVLALFGNVP